MSMSIGEEKGYTSATTTTKPAESCSIVLTHFMFTWWLILVRNHLCAHMLAAANRLVRLAIKINTKNLFTSGRINKTTSTSNATSAQRNSSRRTTSIFIIKGFIKIKDNEFFKTIKWKCKEASSFCYFFRIFHNNNSFNESKISVYF